MYSDKLRIRKFYKNVFPLASPSVTCDFNNLVLALAEDFHEKIVLDVGCGKGYMTVNSAYLGASLAIGIDFSYPLIKYAKKIAKRNKVDAEFIIGDAESMPFRSEVFDRILCSEVLEHIPNINNAMEEIARTLDENGLLVLSAPNQFNLRGILTSLASRFGLLASQVEIQKITPFMMTDILTRSGLLIKDVRSSHFLLGIFPFKLAFEILFTKLSAVFRKKIRKYLKRIVQYIIPTSIHFPQKLFIWKGETPFNVALKPFSLLGGNIYISANRNQNFRRNQKHGLSPTKS